MSDTEPTDVQPEQEPEQEPAAPVAERTRLRDLVFGLRALVAVALAGLIVGGLAGFGINAATGDERDGPMGRFGPGGGFQEGPGGRGGPGGFPQGPDQMGPGGQAPQLPQGPQAPQPSQSPGQDS